MMLLPTFRGIIPERQRRTPENLGSMDETSFSVDCEADSEERKT
jgi:hypothetical protein